MKRPFKKPRITTRDLNMRVTFYRYKIDDGPLPDEVTKETLKTCWAKVDSVWERDIEQAKNNGSIQDIKIKIRDFREEFSPDVKQRVSVNHPFYENKEYEVESVNPDETEKDFILIVAKLVK